jgi:microcystin-dependent protein
MPRDSNGAYNLPAGTLVNSGDTILPSQHNPAMSDIANALSGSLSRDGLGGMRNDFDFGGFKGVNVAAGTDPNDVAIISQTGRDVGEITEFPLPPPSNGKWLLCYGQAVSRTTYADLFDYLGTAYGPGDGSTTFNLPDRRGRVSAGKDDMGGTPAGRLTGFGLQDAGVGGTETVTLTLGQIPSHNHTINDPGHSHTYNRAPIGGNAWGGGFDIGVTGAQTGTSTTGITINNNGGGGAHSNVQPTAISYICIRAFK